MSTVLPWQQTIHHDGSSHFVSNPLPSLGDVVDIHLRVGREAPIERIFLRTFPDGEQAFTTMQIVDRPQLGQWWHAPLPINQPLVHYRFVLETAEGIHWYTGAGLLRHEPLDVFDFKLLADYHSPQWLQTAVFYQIFPDRFANGDPGNDPRPNDERLVSHGYEIGVYPWGSEIDDGRSGSASFFGGDLNGVVQQLDYLETLGINAIYLNPVFTAYSSHRYDVVDFKAVDPHLGGDDALIALRQALSARDMHYILDITPNHCGYKHPWFLAAQADQNAPEAAFFTFNQHPHDYVSWLGRTVLAKLNYTSPELRQRMYTAEDAIVRYWLNKPFSADGWRVDVANMLGRQGPIQMNTEVARAIREAVKETNPDAYVMAESFFDASPSLQGDQWDGVMNYMGLTLPLWHWLRGYRQDAINFPDEIRSEVPYTTEALATTIQERLAAIPWAIALQQYNILDSHDTERIRTIVGENDALHRLAAIIQFAFPGVPGVYYGDEIGMVDSPTHGARACMPWDQADWDLDLLAFYRDLIALRKRSATLQRGGFKILAVDKDRFAFQREGETGAYVIVVANRAVRPHAAGGLPVAHGGIPDGVVFTEHFSGQQATVQDGSLPLPGQPQGAMLWRTAEN